MIALRRGDTWQANLLLRTHAGLLKEWLSQVLVKGSTTRDDVVTLLGPRLQDLDRPDRDAVVTQQYYMGTHTAFTALVFDFDARTGILLDWSTSQGICGLCPHVFADDGQWRLEGKLLAGCIGSDHEGTDTLLLPRLVEREGRAHVKVSNLAPEIEFLDQVQLGSVRLEENEELDVGHDGRPYAWCAPRELVATFEPVDGQFAECAINLPHSLENNVIVLEARNTSEFETAMREFVFGKRPRPESTDMHIEFDGGTSVRIAPVGTKFLRRSVIPVPPGSDHLRLQVRPEMWLVRRMWIGTGRSVAAATDWQTPITAVGPVPTALTLISTPDHQRLVLEPQEEVEVGFLAPGANSKPARLGYILRITGYYDFLTGTQPPNKDSVFRNRR